MGTDDLHHATRRFGLGGSPDPGAQRGDARSWLRAQLDPGVVRSGPAAVATPREIAGACSREREARRADDASARDSAREELRTIARGEARRALSFRVRTPTPFLERLVAFWSNHLCVSMAGKRTVGPLAGWYERTAIRPHVLSRYEEMVLASARHPAMLVYLDNVASIGPRSPAARRASHRGRDRGLNENHARELLELHTLGVNGGYTQPDVESLARMLTGWTVRGVGRDRDAGGEPGFVFRPERHEPGAKVLLGVRHAEAGEEEGRRAIVQLCRHPATAVFLATRLARHFIADDPPAGAVERLARTYRETDGDLLAVSLELVDLDEAWDPSCRKFRSPQDWLVAVLRLAPPPELPDLVARALRQLRHPLWAPAAPSGFGDTLADWADPDSLMNRAELSRRLAGHLRRRGWKSQELVELIPAGARDDLLAIMAGDLSDRDRIALAVGGPGFQWR